MNNVRVLLWFALLTMLWLAFNQWMQDYGEPAAAPTPATTEAPLTDTLPAAADTLPDVAEPPGAAAQLPATEEAGTAGIAEPIRVRTDVLDVLIDRQGGDIVRVDLPTFPVEKDDPDVVVRLLDYPASQRWIYQTGIRHATDTAGPTHLETYTSAASSYELREGADELAVTLEWTGDAGVSGRKIYTFRRGRFDIDLAIELENQSGASWPGVGYGQMTRINIPSDRSFMSVESYSFTGPVLYDGDSYEKLDFEDLQEQAVDQQLAGGWLASIQHHFLGALVPPPEDVYRFVAAARGNEYVLSAVSGATDVANESIERYPFKLFVGPKLQEQLAETGEGLELTVDYGMLTVLANPLFWLLDQVHGFVGNWGWSIILVTILIKLVFYKLTAASGRSMAKMRRLAPRMKALQDRFKDDRQALSQAMMELYKKEKVNPAAGCLPILIQMPFFFAFYWVLIESVEMRQAPFMLWIDDLSVMDPFFVLPLLMGAAMFLQTRLNPAPPDPVQARIMQIMPLVFTVFFAFFPAGLVLYWLTNTVLSIAQQWRINKLVEAEAA